MSEEGSNGKREGWREGGKGDLRVKAYLLAHYVLELCLSNGTGSVAESAVICDKVEV